MDIRGGGVYQGWGCNLRRWCNLRRRRRNLRLRRTNLSGIAHIFYYGENNTNIIVVFVTIIRPSLAKSEPAEKWS